MQQIEIWKEVERFNVLRHENPSMGDFALDLPSVFELVRQRTNASKPPAMASVFMRHVAFVYVSQLYMLSKYRKKWSGDHRRIGLLDGESNGRWSPQWTFQDGDWVSVDDDEHVRLTLQNIIREQCLPLIKAVARQTKSSPLVLWENVWGYVLWMYTQLFQDSEDVSKQARGDLEFLLKDETWTGMERRSPFKRFLNDQTPEESMSNYSRVTCCLYYMIPGNEKCPYCPKLSTDRCLQE
ncbi:IucA/IucC family C-terminal-domain containing protein [Peribacillus glennii]|uniref:Ferric siderophore reductase C-terminal domain-containing protein n=1 Tax=Peribacillus glennii TaxID=2303991 RepID=A0A372LIB7_9BACI|nr:IucA/IucC family C-terminal-domain containing protein [Peribacillus glennii]RFU66033.1 hypothetical protein D0466_03745 [Peribacillus glennii]